MISITKGDKRAFDELYQRYSGPLVSFFFRLMWKDRAKSEDFMHDLFAKIIRKPESFDPTRSFKTWMYSVANNMVKNEYKKMEVRKIMDTETDTAHVVNHEIDPLHITEEQLFKQRLFEELGKELRRTSSESSQMDPSNERQKEDKQSTHKEEDSIPFEDIKAQFRAQLQETQQCPQG